jgi:hypothetical protein
VDTGSTISGGDSPSQNSVLPWTLHNLASSWQTFCLLLCLFWLVYYLFPLTIAVLHLCERHRLRYFESLIKGTDRVLVGYRWRWSRTISLEYTDLPWRPLHESLYPTAQTDLTRGATPRLREDSLTTERTSEEGHMINVICKTSEIWHLPQRSIYSEDHSSTIPSWTSTTSRRRSLHSPNPYIHL